METEASIPPQIYWPLLFTYHAEGGDGHGVSGVSDLFPVAERQLIAALRTMPEGTAGTIRLAILDNRLPRPEYRYGPVVVRLRRDADGGVVVMDDDLADVHVAEPPGARGQTTGNLWP